MPKSYQGVTSNIHIKSLNICNIAFDAFFEDTKALVAKGVRTDIAHQKASAPTKKLFAQISDYASTRESSLAAWLKIDHPLAFQDTKGNNVYKLLLQAVSQDDHAVAQGLPNWSLFATTRLALAESLFLMSHPSHRSDQNTPTAKAPVLSTGSFFPVLKVVNHALVVLSRARDKEAIKSFVLNAFMMSFDIFKVDFFPQCLPPTGVRGRPQSTPLFNSWGHLGNLHHPIVSMNVPSPSPLVPPLNVAYNNANADNCHGPWTVTDLKLENVRSIILKSTLPTDYEIPAGAKDQYVIDTYAWVKQNYDHNKTLHHLALLVAIVAASFLPYLFIPTDLKHLFTNAHTNADVRKVYEQIDWIDKPKQNGMVKRGIFVAMFTTYIIAIYEPESPLRTYMKSAKKGGLGEGWRNKHKAKGITYQLFIRLGVLWGKGTGAYDKGTFRERPDALDGWGCHPKEHVQNLYDVLKNYITGTPFGPFDAFTILIGERNALLFACRDNRTYQVRPKNIPREDHNSDDVYIVDDFSQ